MTVAIDMGSTRTGTPAQFDLEELLATRLLVQGNSGSGKSHLLRRLMEQSAPWMQQAVIDPEGDFVTLADAFGHIVIEAADHSEAALQQIAARARQHRVSTVLNLEQLDADQQMKRAAAFLGGLFDVEREYWFPMLVVVDEAQLFAPAAAGEVSDEARKASLGAMTNLMCRGRKRGLAGVIATQRLAKLAKNVAAEASNFLMGRTFLDIDMARAADLLGMDRRQAEQFRDLGRGQFVALGPAISRRPLPVSIGPVTTAIRAGSPKLLPLPETPREDARDLLLTAIAEDTARPVVRRPPPPPTSDVLEQLALSRPAPALAAYVATSEAAQAQTPAPAPPSLDEILLEILSAPDSAGRSIAVLYQDFLVRCRSRRVNGRSLDLTAFRRRLTALRTRLHAPAQAGDEWEKVAAIAMDLSEDLHPVFLLIARAAAGGEPCPSDHEIARARGSSSPRRARGLLAHLEQQGLIVCDSESEESRVIHLPQLGWRTAPGHPDALPAEPLENGPTAA
jgi:hypothetical protein